VRWWETEEGQQGLQTVRQDYGGQRTEDNRFTVCKVQLDDFEAQGLLEPTVMQGKRPMLNQAR